MWYPVVSKDRFTSKIRDSDVLSSGKWLVPIPFNDPESTWEKLEDAALDGKLDAVKLSHERLNRILGHKLVCVYCEMSHKWYVSQTLIKLRALGIGCDLQYKSDKATQENREEYLWNSVDIHLQLDAALKI